MKKPAHTLILAILFCASATALAQNWASTRPIEGHERAALFPTSRMLEMGRVVAQSECARCHGMDGMGTKAGQPHLASQRVIYLYRELRAYQQSDGRDNKAMQHISSILNDEAMLAVAAYYANQSPAATPTTAEAPPEPLAEDAFAGIRNALKKCVKCHGETGNSGASGMPSLTAQSPEYFDIAIRAYMEDGDRDHRLMNRLVTDLDETTISQMGLFYAVQEPARTETVGDGDPAAGKKAAEACATCHGDDGNASGADVPTLAGQDARYFVKAMQAYRQGKRSHERMVEAAAALGEKELSDLATYYAQQEPIRRNIRAPFSTVEWIERCERCHGINGNSTDPRFPMLAGQDEGYLRKAMEAYSSGKRSVSVMHAMSEPLTESDITQIASHYARQSPRAVVYVNLPCEESEEE